MKIPLTEIWAKNFKSYKDFHLRDLDKVGLVLVTGPNGSGKSAIRNIIEYLIVDTTAEKLPLSDLTYNQEGNCEVGGVFNQDGRTITITKYRDHKTEGNSIVLDIDGDTSLTHTDRRKTQKEIENLFGIDSNRIFGSTVFTKHAPSFPEASESDRKEVLYKFLDLERFKIRHKKAKEDLQKVLKELSEIDIPSIEDRLREERDSLLSLEDSKESWAEDNESSIEETKKKIASISMYDTTSAEKEVEELKTKIIEVDLDEYNNLINCKKSAEDLVKLRNKIIEIPDVPDSMKESVESVESLLEEKNELSEKLYSLTDDRGRWNAKIVQLSNEVQAAGDGVCPILSTSCKDLSEKRDEILKRIQPKIEEINETVGLIDKRIKKLSIKENEINDRIETINRVKVQIARIESDRESLLKEQRETEAKKQDILSYLNENCKYSSIDDIDNRISVLKNLKESNISLQKDIEEAENRLRRLQYDNDVNKQRKEDLEASLLKQQESKNPYTHLCVEKNTMILKLEKEIEKDSKAFKKLEEKKRMYEFWVEGYSSSGIPNLLIESYLDEIEDLINDNLKHLFPGAVVSLSATTDLKSGDTREKISYKVITPDSRITSYGSYSEGERQRIKVADMFAFSELLTPFNFMFLDEMLETALDDGGIDSIIKFIREKTSHLSSVFVVSHIQNTKNRFDNVIEIEKEKGVSKIK